MKKLVFLVFLMFLFLTPPAHSLTILAGTVQGCIIEEAVDISGGASLLGSTIYGNTVTASGNCTIRNCIIENTGGTDLTVDNLMTVTGGYNNFDDAAVAGAGTYNGAANDNYSSDPNFINASAGTIKGFGLKPRSPCRGAGVFITGFHDEGALDILGRPISKNPRAPIAIGALQPRMSWWGRIFYSF